jgi:C-terminal processing protease CtpA/Prc
VVVSVVAPDGAALESGVAVGDRLIAIDGRPAAAMTLEEIRAMLMQHGETRSLLILREGQEIAVSITLRRRI